jgi:eukaryotic-like serine/threonine-protein kinase
MKNILRLIAVFSCLYFLTTTAAADDTVVWKYKTGGGIYAAPLVHNDVLYIGSTDSIFYAINAATGAKVWHYKTDNPIRSTAAIDGNVVCFESGNKLYGLDLQGNLLWLDTLCSGSAANQFDQWDYFHSSPNIVEGVAYIGTEKGKVFGINMQTGAVVFQCQTQNTNNGIRVKPAIHNNKIYFGDWDGVLFVYDLVSGQKLWQYDTFPERGWTGGLPSITTSPVIFDGSVYFAGRSCILYSLNAETGAKQATFSDGNMWLVGGPTISDSLLFLGSSNQKVLRAFYRQTLNICWTYSVDGRVMGTPLVDNDYVYIGTGVEPGDAVGSIYVLNKKTGEIKNRFVLDAMVHSSPVISDTMLYVGSADKCIYAFGKQKLFNKPYSKTAFHENQTFTFGNIYQDTTITFQIDNTGDKSDTISLAIPTPSLKSAIIIEPNNIILAPHSSQNINFSIQISLLGPKRYYTNLDVASKSNLVLKNFSQVISFIIPQLTSVESNNEILPDKWSLSQNYPNPFNAATTIRYNLPQSCPVILKIYNQIGQEIETFIDGYQSAGTHSVQWNADKLTSGIYFYRLKSNGFNQTRKLILLK